MNHFIVFAVTIPTSTCRRRRERHRDVGRRIDEQLEGEPRQVAVARHQRQHGGEVAAGGTAADCDPRPIDAASTAS
jgi:hypothetical protein